MLSRTMHHAPSRHALKMTSFHAGKVILASLLMPHFPLFLPRPRPVLHPTYAALPLAIIHTRLPCAAPPSATIDACDILGGAAEVAYRCKCCRHIQRTSRKSASPFVAPGNRSLMSSRMLAIPIVDLSLSHRLKNAWRTFIGFCQAKEACGASAFSERIPLACV